MLGGTGWRCPGHGGWEGVRIEEAVNGKEQASRNQRDRHVPQNLGNRREPEVPTRRVVHYAEGEKEDGDDEARLVRAIWRWSLCVVLVSMGTVASIGLALRASGLRRTHPEWQRKRGKTGFNGQPGLALRRGCGREKGAPQFQRVACCLGSLAVSGPHLLTTSNPPARGNETTCLRASHLT